MKTILDCVACAAVAGGILIAGEVSLRASWDWRQADRFGHWAASQREEAAVAGWPESSRLTARKMMEKYGEPDAVSGLLLAWSDRAPWKQIVVYRQAGTGKLGVGEGDILQESVAYEVPVAKWRALSAFGRGVSYDPARRELSARSDGEAKNFLALNLADEIVRGKRDAVSAQLYYDKTMGLSLSGKSSRYMRKLVFSVPKSSRKPMGEGGLRK